MPTNNKPRQGVAPAEEAPTPVNSLSEPFEPLSFESVGTGTDYLAELKRNQVLQIIESYHHDFDQFYESIQNAVDACQKAFDDYETKGRSAEYSPQVEVFVSLKENSLTVIDNGLGMSKDTVRKFFFTPYATSKGLVGTGPQAIQRGEKGVGATFVSYGANYVHLSTILPGRREMTSCELSDGLAWCTKRRELLPLPAVRPCACNPKLLLLPHGTAIEIRFSDDTNIKQLSEYGKTSAQWEAILRLHTALGFVDPDSNDQFLKSLRATLTLILPDDSSQSSSVSTGYFYPHLRTDAHVQLSKLARNTQGHLPESQRDMNILWETFPHDQVSSVVTERMTNMRYMRSSARSMVSQILSRYKPDAYVGFAYSADYWEESNQHLWGGDGEGQFKHGMVFATKSQKIGEQKRIEFKFRSGDFNRFFILLNMRDLKADIGRKSLPEEITEFANFFANAIQKKFVDNDDCLRPSPGPFDEGLEIELEQLKDKAIGLTRLGLNGLHFTREPQEEQDVVALFFDLLGSGKLRGFDVYSTHISRTYDGIGQFVLRDVPENHYDPTNNPLGVASGRFQGGEVRSPTKNFLEFKYSTDGFVNDVRSGYKRMQDIKWLVCWTIGEKHIEQGIGIIDITIPAQVNKRDYYGITHLMTENQAKVYVVCLKRVLELLGAA